MKKMNLATKGLIGIQFMKLHFLINVDQQKGLVNLFLIMNTYYKYHIFY